MVTYCGSTEQGTFTRSKLASGLLSVDIHLWQHISCFFRQTLSENSPDDQLLM